MPARRVALLVLLALAPLGGAAGASPLTAPAPAPNAVLAVIDTGIDPYHPVFRDTSPRAFRHPSTYLPGYPRDAVALRLGRSFAADCARIWEKVRPGRLYWFPGTKIVGALSTDLTRKSGTCAGMPVYDEHGHGTMTASRAVGNGYGACPACRVVSVQFQTGYGIDNSKAAEVSAVNAVRWAADAPWIDGQSNSWGPLPVPDPAGAGGLFTESPALARAAEDAARKQLAFWSTGNGLARIAGVLGMPTTATPHHGPSSIRVGGHDSGQVALWPGLSPHLVGDACESWAAEAGTGNSGPEVGGGTSAAAPYVAGGAVATLLHARSVARDARTGVRGGVVAKGRKTQAGPLADGVLTLAEWRDVVFRTATARPAAQPEDGAPCDAADAPFTPTPVKWSDVPEAAPTHLLVGYGAVDRAAVARARAVVSGAAALPDRAAADAYFAEDRRVREALHQVFRG